MTEHLCEQCGAANAADAQFCAKCDFYLGWDTGGGSLDGAPLTASVPVVRETHSQKFPAVSLSEDRHQSHEPSTTARHPSAARPAMAPKVSVDNPEVMLDPHAGGTVDVRIHNRSSIVDGYTVTAPNAPPWLEITQPEIRLLTDHEEVFTVSLGRRREWTELDVYVQRFHLAVQIRSVEDPSKRTDVDLMVVVPRIGGPVTISAEPQVVRLRDQTTGRFRVRLDNTGSNYPQRYALNGSDQQRVVRLSFRPHIVEVPPRRVLFTDARFDAPPLQYGQQANHTLTITAGSDEGPLQTVVNVVQERSQAPPDSPVQLRLEPSVTRARDLTSAEISVIVDNRRGSKDRRLYFSGRDPERKVRFAFSQQQLDVRAREQARISVRIDAPLPDPGEEVPRAFAVVCNDGTDESEATGSLVQMASALPITSAQIRLDPQHVVVRNRSRGRFLVTVDNSRGALPLSVWLSGTDPEGAVRFTFTPRRLDLRPGGSGRAKLRVSARLPGSGKEAVREIKVSAGDGVGVVEAQGRFSQSMSDILPILRMVLTLLGGLLVLVGALRPWFSGVGSYSVEALFHLQGQISELNKAIHMRDAPEIEEVALTIWQPAARGLMWVLAAVMMLGILGATGRATIRAGFAIAILMMLFTVYAMIRLHSNWPAYGAQLVVLGAIVGIIGGFCIKRTGPP